MRSLVIAPQPVFSPRGTPFSVYYRTLVASSQGVTIDLLTYGEGDDFHIPGVRIIRIPAFSFLGKVRVGPSFLKLFYDMIMVCATVILLLSNRYDFVHAHEEAVFFCLALKPLFRFKLVYDMHSSLPQQLTNFKFTSFKPLKRLFGILEAFSLKGADAVISICPDLAEYAVSAMAFPERHFLIENSIFEPVRLSEGPGQEGSREENLPLLPSGKRFVVYAGTLEPYQGIDLLLGAFSLVVEKIPDAFLIVAGGTKEQVERYRRTAETLHIDSGCLFTGRVPQAVAKYLCGKASVQVSPRCRGTNTPLKIYEQLASGVPLVATRIHSHTQVLSHDTALLVEAEPVDMARGITEALFDPALGAGIAENARIFYMENYSRAVYEKKIERMLGILT